MQIIMQQGAVVGVASFTTGFVPRKRTCRRMNEDDIMAMALWLERHGRRDEGEALLDRWCTGFVLYIH